MSPEKKPSLINRSVILQGIFTAISGASSGLALYEGQHTTLAISATAATLSIGLIINELERNIRARRIVLKNSPDQKNRQL